MNLCMLDIVICSITVLYTILVAVGLVPVNEITALWAFAASAYVVGRNQTLDVDEDSDE